MTVERPATMKSKLGERRRRKHRCDSKAWARTVVDGKLGIDGRDGSTPANDELGCLQVWWQSERPESRFGDAGFA